MCVTALPRLGITPPGTGPPDNRKISLLWPFGFALLYLVSVILYVAAKNYWGNVLFYPLVFTTVFTIYYCGYQRLIKQHRINPQRTRFPDLFRYDIYAIF